MSTELVHRVRRLLADAAVGQPEAVSGPLAAAAERFDEPLRVALAGRVKAGKSTLLNALVGEPLAPTDAGECTRFVTWYRYGEHPAASAVRADGTRVPLAVDRTGGPVAIDLAPVDGDAVDHLELRWPASALVDFTFIDTPGIDTASPTVARRTWDAVAPEDDRASVADAVVYLVRHMHGADIRFLESFAGDPIAQPSPVHCFGVLARADEVGGASPDALVQADRVASRYGRDPRFRRLCSAVVPVAGLVAEGAASISHADFVALSALAGAGDEGLLLDADSFVADVEPAPAGVPAEVRAALLDRLGLYGVRSAIAALSRADGPPNGADLGALLGRSSGVEHLVSLLQARMAARRDLLKVRSALAEVGAVLGRAAHDPALDREIEAIAAGAHELREAQLLDTLRRADLGFSDAEIAAAEQLLGGHGGGTAHRLGAVGPTAQAALAAELARWHSRAHNPLTTREGAVAAEILVRTCEGLIAQI